MLQQFVVLQLRANDLSNIFFQQDGAISHFAGCVRDFLNTDFPNRRDTFEWAPRSPDLTSYDFFLWSHIKSRAHVT